ncbi:MAG: DUF4406 domain-containing protein [Pseudomonadota bacterium]|nr:DUF4406 domain-containing protein [Pseudomonadota bacterium]
MKRIFVCSPYAGDIQLNELVAETLCHQVIKIGHAPFAPHLLYPRFLDDSIDVKREIGIRTGLTFLRVCHEVWVYTGNGISLGMQCEIDYANEIGKPVIPWACEEV